MLRKTTDYKKQDEIAPMDGAGHMLHETLFASQEFSTQKVSLCARMTLEPNASVGPHTHEGENEIYYILSGNGTVLCDGKTLPVSAGDCTLTRHGEAHNITNTGNMPLVFLAIVIRH